jgi:hypothetical protein
MLAFLSPLTDCIPCSATGKYSLQLPGSADLIVFTDLDELLHVEECDASAQAITSELWTKGDCVQLHWAVKGKICEVGWERTWEGFMRWEITREGRARKWSN